MPIDTEAKYHHLIPRAYLSAWEFGKGTLNVEFLSNPGTIVLRNKDNIAGITDYHSIKAGMPICTQNDTDLIFAPLSSYKVVLDGRQLTNTLEMNERFGEFEKWDITRQDGTKVRKKPILREIEKVKIKDIERNWSEKYENYWPEQVSKIEKCILTSSTDHVKAFDKEFIMKFFVALDWRSFTSNEQFDAMLDLLLFGLEDTVIPQEARILPQIKTAKEEMRHYLLLNYYRQYLNDSGVMIEYVKAYLKKTSFHFLVSDGSANFITSDNPSFIHKAETSSLMGLLPITPKILMIQGRDESNADCYYITHISEEEVQHYNRIIREHADSFVVHK